MKCHNSKFNNEITSSFYVFKNLKFSKSMLQFLLEKNDEFNVDLISNNDPIIYDNSNYEQLFEIPSYQ